MPFKSSNKNLRVSFGDDSSVSADHLDSIRSDDAPMDHVFQDSFICNSDTGMDVHQKPEPFPEANSSCETITSGVSATSYEVLADRSDNGAGAASLSSSSQVLNECFCIEKHDLSVPPSCTCILTNLECLCNQLDSRNSLDEDGTSSDLKEPDSLNAFSSSSLSKVISDFPFK